MRLLSWNMQWCRGMDGADEPPYCCDLVFVTPEIAPRVPSVRVDAHTRASEHQPVIVDFS